MGKKSSMKKMTGITKVATQIEGLDEILNGGLPQGRTSLISGGPGTGKTLLALEFIYRGALSGVPGIFLSFEETTEGLHQNALSFGWDLASLEKTGKLFLLGGQVEPLGVISGDFNLKGLLAVIEGKSKEIGAEKIVIDALDVLLHSFKDSGRERQQIQMLHQWLNKEGMTAILTAKNQKEAALTAFYNHLDFMADCVIYLDQRISDQVNTKRIQIIKYRGSGYGSNEYPFLITDNGLFFDPISDMQLHYPGPSQRISSGNPSLDEILGGGYQGGSCILISGATGTGKTSIASSFARCACENGQKVLYISFEESPDGLIAGMRSIGIDLRPFIESASLRIMSVMPESKGIEEHLYDKITTIKSFQPQHLVVDAISACERIAGKKASFDFIMRLVHFCKKKGITAVLINQGKSAGQEGQVSGIGISSIIDSIITLRYKDTGNETHRVLQIKKSRGSKHSNRYHNYLLTDNGIQFHTVQPKQTRVTAD
jgi:circadian clock protein KaiC